MTSPTTRATRRCAARCAGRIELAPSRRLAAIWALWLIACLAVLLGGLALPWAARIILGLILVAANVPAIRSSVLLRGQRAVRIVEWDEEGRFQLRGAVDADPEPAIVRPASFRLGIAFLVLWFATPTGTRLVLVDGGCQDPVAFRRLTRHLARGMLIPSRPKV